MSSLGLELLKEASPQSGCAAGPVLGLASDWGTLYIFG